MPLVTWTEALSVGIPSVDTQHKKLVALLNDLYAAVVALRGQQEIAGALEAMTAYSREHFSFEEQWMAQAAYPEEKMHRAAHLQFVEFADRSERKLRGGEFVSSVELLASLQDWLTNHIMNVDRRYGACLLDNDPGRAVENAS
jgi:hemerythrin